jgi:hypothetical protein
VEDLPHFRPVQDAEHIGFLSLIVLFFVPLFQIFSMPHSAPFQKNALTKFPTFGPSKLQGYEGRKAK